MQEILWVGFWFRPDENHMPSVRSQQSAIKSTVAGWIICNKTHIEELVVKPIMARLTIHHRSEGRVITLSDITGNLFAFGVLVNTAGEGIARLAEVRHWLTQLGIVGEPRVMGWDALRGTHFADTSLPQ